MKRTLIVILACLCVGFVLNAVIALTLGAMIPSYTVRSAATILSDFEKFDASYISEPRVTRATAAASDMQGGDGWALVVTSGSLRQEGRGSAKSSTIPEQYGEIISTRAGWPWHCLEGEVANTPNEQPTTTVRRGWVSPEHASTKLQHRPAGERISVMPTTPMWSGVFWNTLLLSSPFVVVSLMVLGALRMRLRDRLLTGHCQDCGYPLDQLPACPECGATAPVYAPDDQASGYQ